MNMRESFEKDAKAAGYATLNRRADNGCYEYAPTEHAWQGYQLGWQASRAAIVLPEPPHGDSFVTLQQVKQAIGVDVR